MPSIITRESGDRGGSGSNGGIIEAAGRNPGITGAPGPSDGAEFAIGASCALTNLFYGPAKVFYALGGGLVATVAYAFSGGDMEVARPIVDAALRGDYVLTPDHFRGTRQWEFVGRPPAGALDSGGGSGEWGGGDDPGF